MSNNEIIVITGAGQGIGKQVAKNVNKKYDLLLLSKSLNCRKTAYEIIKEKSSKKRIIKYLRINFEKNPNNELLKTKINFKKYKKIHLILCAGIVDYNIKSYLNIKDWIKIFNVNFFANIKIINLFLSYYRKSKRQNKIIIFSGGGVANAFKEFPIYSASKIALVRTVENYSQIFKKLNLSIFAVAPGATKTKMLSKVLKIASVGTRSDMKDVILFINKCLKINTKFLNGKLVHIRDDLKKIAKNKDVNFLKIRREQ